MLDFLKACLTFPGVYQRRWNQTVAAAEGLLARTDQSGILAPEDLEATLAERGLTQEEVFADLGMELPAKDCVNQATQREL